MIWKSLFVNFWTLWANFRRNTMMAKIYFNRLIIGTITFDAINERYQNAVREYGKDWVKKGKLTIEEYELLYKEEYQE